MSAPGFIETRGAPHFELAAGAIVVRQTIEHAYEHGTAVALSEATSPGLARLTVGPVDRAPEFPNPYGCSIDLDAAACRHLARLLDAKADEISGHGAPDQEAVS